MTKEINSNEVDETSNFSSDDFYINHELTFYMNFFEDETPNQIGFEINKHKNLKEKNSVEEEN